MKPPENQNPVPADVGLLNEVLCAARPPERQGGEVMTDTINVPRKLLERIIGKMNIVWQKTDETEELRTLLQAPAQPAQVQEPVGRIGASHGYKERFPIWYTPDGSEPPIGTKLYTTPQPSAGVVMPDALLLEFATSRWHAEVANRPLVNVHRRALDGTWRQVIRFAGGDPDALCGPSHDELIARLNGKEVGRG